MPAPEENPQQPVQPQQPAQPQIPTAETTTVNTSTNTTGGVLTTNTTQSRVLTTEEYVNGQTADGGLIPFSMGLDSLQFTGPGIASNVTDVTLSGELTGYWVNDPALKQFGAEMTVFQSFPVNVVAANAWSSVTDHTSTIDNQGTNLGYLTMGQFSYPDNFKRELLEKIATNLKGGGFKVGASIHNRIWFRISQTFLSRSRIYSCTF